MVVNLLLRRMNIWLQFHSRKHFNKVLEFFQKKTKSGEKQQEIEKIKINLYSKIIMIIVLTALFMCVLAAIFPSLSITE